MADSRIELAVLNNVAWYQAMFKAHGLACTADDQVWMSHETPPPLHSNLVVVSPTLGRQHLQACIRELEQVDRPDGWTLKDSYAGFDLASLGFRELFHANWIWLDSAPAASTKADPQIEWRKVATAEELLEWEAAWRGDARNDSASAPLRQFPTHLLASPDFAFLWAKRQGAVVAGGVATRSPGVVGLSNVFCRDADLIDTWSGLIRLAANEFPNRPLVGYEGGADLAAAQQVSFTPLGPLVVWRRPGATHQ